MEPLNRKELFKKTKYFLVGKVMHIIFTLFSISILVYAIIIQDRKTIFYGILAVLMLVIMLIVDRTIPYFFDLICLEHKITDLVIENKANGGIQGRYRFETIGGDRKVTCIDGKKLMLVDIHKINVKIPENKMLFRRAGNEYNSIYEFSRFINIFYYNKRYILYFFMCYRCNNVFYLIDIK